MRNTDDMTIQEQFDREDRADRYRARRDAQSPTERDESKRKQRIANRAFQARKSSEERVIAAKKSADYQRARRANETPAERKKRNLENAWDTAVWRARRAV